MFYTALETPILSYEVVFTRKDVQNVTLIWTTAYSSKTDMKYLLTVSSSTNSRPKYSIMEWKQMKKRSDFESFQEQAHFCGILCVSNNY